MASPVASKPCGRCKEIKPVTEFSPSRKYSLGVANYCKQCRSLATMESARQNREKVAARQRAWAIKHRVRLAAEKQRKSIAQKLEVLSAYGGARCVCCGETELIFLALDHVDDDGAIRRRAGERSGQRLYKDLKAAGFPPSGFQVLCFNCNWAKSRGGCPHQAVRPDEGARLFEPRTLGRRVPDSRL